MSGTKLADSVDQKLWKPNVSPGSYLAYNNWLPYGNTGIPMCTTGPTAATSYLMSDNLASSAKFAQNNAGMATTPYSWRNMYETIFNNSGTCGQKGINCNVNANAKGPNPFVNAKNNELGCLSYPNSCTDGTGSGLDPTPGGGSSTDKCTECDYNTSGVCYSEIDGKKFCFESDGKGNCPSKTSPCGGKTGYCGKNTGGWFDFPNCNNLNRCSADTEETDCNSPTYPTCFGELPAEHPLRKCK